MYLFVCRCLDFDKVCRHKYHKTKSYISYVFIFCRCLDLDKVCSKLRENKVIYFICIYLSVGVVTSTKSAQNYEKTKLYISYVFICLQCFLTSTKSADTCICSYSIFANDFTLFGLNVNFNRYGISVPQMTTDMFHLL